MAEPETGDVATEATAPTGTDTEPREGGVTAEERAAALAAGAPRVPRRAVAWGFVAAAVLALGGTALERAFSSAGLNPSTATTTTTAPPTIPPSNALLAMTPLTPAAPPRISLRDQRGRAVPLAGARGEVTVITFFNASCADACPVVADELRAAEHDLGPLARRVRLLTVNTDPLALGAAPTPAAVTRTGLAALPNWHYLTGPLRTLNPIWRAFGVTISVYEATRVVVHNDVIYLESPAGELVSRGSPFSDESSKGVFSLPAPLELVAGHGLAASIRALLVARR